jgi:four helix bundle protein
MDNNASPNTARESDPLNRMAVVRFARHLVKVSWDNVQTLKTDSATQKIAGQLYESVGSIAANIAEGYSKGSGRDRARSYEYALGSARETVEWYNSAMPVLGAETVNARLDILGHVQRLLLSIIPKERERTIRRIVSPKLPGSRR